MEGKDNYDSTTQLRRGKRDVIPTVRNITETERAVRNTALKAAKESNPDGAPCRSVDVTPGGTRSGSGVSSATFKVPGTPNSAGGARGGTPRISFRGGNTPRRAISPEPSPAAKRMKIELEEALKEKDELQKQLAACMKQLQKTTKDKGQLQEEVKKVNAKLTETTELLEGAVEEAKRNDREIFKMNTAARTGLEWLRDALIDEDLRNYNPVRHARASTNVKSAFIQPFEDNDVYISLEDITEMQQKLYIVNCCTGLTYVNVLSYAMVKAKLPAAGDDQVIQVVERLSNHMCKGDLFNEWQTL